MFSNEIFRYSEAKTSTQNRDTPPPPCSNFFDSRNYCNSKGFPYGNFRYCETKNFRRKILILLPPPFIQTFSIPEINETLKDSTPTGIFGPETKNFRRKILIPPPPSLMHKFFRYPKFSDTPKCSPTKFFGAVRQKILNEKSCIEYRNQWWN